MKFVLCLGDVRHLRITCQIPVHDVLLQTSTFTKTGNIAESELSICIAKLREAKKHVIFNCDIACDNKTIDRLAVYFQQFAPEVHSVRYKDQGLGRWLSRKFPDIPLQMSLENYSLNLNSILQWLEQSSQQINRIVLSNQIPISEIKTWRSKIGIDIEIQALGPLEGFNSARNLLKSQMDNLGNRNKIQIISNDRIQNQLTAIDNSHGTTLQFEEELFLLDELSTIESAGVNYVYLNITEHDQYELLLRHFPGDKWMTDLQARWGRKTTKGFFHGNKTDTHFKNLTNAILQSKKSQQIGTVIELVKQKYTLVELRQNVDLPTKIVFFTPNAKQIPFAIRTLRCLDGSLNSKCAVAGYYKLPWIKNVVPSTAIHLQENFSA